MAQPSIIDGPRRSFSEDGGGGSSRPLLRRPVTAPLWYRAKLLLALTASLSLAGVASAGSGATAAADHAPDSTSPATPKPATAAATTDRDRELKTASQVAAIVKQGREVFTALCQACHGGEAAQGDAVSNLFDAKWHHGETPSQIERTILTGVLDKGMPGWGEILPAEDTTALTAYLLSAQK